MKLTTAIITTIFTGLASQAAGNPSANLHRRQCDKFQDGSYKASREPYTKTFNTHLLPAFFAAVPLERYIGISYTQDFQYHTDFYKDNAFTDTSVSDEKEKFKQRVIDIISKSPAEAVGSASNISFVNWQKDAVKLDQHFLRAGEAGQMGFTPYYWCTSGTLKDCDGKETEEKETCAPWAMSGVLQGEYHMVQTG
ncbi:hypothetical protein QBC35DRAFT_495277 [Podospora australis]|uniref:Uncharacterized protein n=1 Tax=Podospora australis TaxID=1536484 RepID=A0AAN6WZH2_9PEZI|nr:hypothetical protein QBC35DRAFT_495277 [Podospora australis]